MINPKGVIFDMDGVLVDTVKMHQKSWEELALKCKKPFSLKHFMQANGIPIALHAIAYGWTECSIESTHLAEQKERIYLERIKRSGLEPSLGVVSLLQRLLFRKIPCAVATSSSKESMDFVLEQAALRSYFKAFVSVEDVKRGKPDPEIFLQAAHQIGIEPGDCVVVEDAVLGIQAAKRAGIYAVAITSTHSREDLKEADRIIDSFAELL